MFGMRTRNSRHSLVFTVAAMAAMSPLAIVAPAQAQQASDQQQIVNEAAATVTAIRNSPQGKDFDAQLANARAVMIAPSLVKAGFIIGGEGGVGVLLARGSNGWTGPVFYDIAKGGIGLQAGVQVSETIFVVRTERGLEKLLSDKVTLGGDVSIAVASVGAGVSGSSTTNMDADIVAFSNAKGLFGGASLDGTVVVPEEDWNRAYYGQSMTADSILRGDASNGKAETLKSRLSGG